VNGDGRGEKRGSTEGEVLGGKRGKHTLAVLGLGNANRVDRLGAAGVHGAWPIGLPEEIASSRLATLEAVNPARMLLHPSRFGLAFLNPRSLTRRAFWKAGMAAPFDEERIYARGVEVPSQGGIGTARAIAHAYGAFATGGRELGLREETLQKLIAPAVAPLHGFHDEAVKLEARLSLGFAKPSPGFPFGSPAAFGTPGAGGSFGFADPQAAVGYAYVTNKMGRELRLLGDPREMALRNAFQRAIREPPLTQPASA
jgi:CubicO group peptidase (beta-lactamase class C family)